MERFKKAIFFVGDLLFLMLGGIVTLTLFLCISILLVVAISEWLIDIPEEAILLTPLVFEAIFIYVYGKKRRWKIFQYVAVIIGVILVVSPFVVIESNPPQNRHRDAQRISDMRQIQLALEFYFDDHNQEYPAATTCTSMQELMQELVPAYLSQATNDPVENHAPYQYAISENRKSYVLKSTLDDIKPPDNRVRDTIMGCGCNGRNYCIMNSPR